MYTDKANGIEVKVVKEGLYNPSWRVVKYVNGQAVLLDKPVHTDKKAAEEYALSLALR